MKMYSLELKFSSKPFINDKCECFFVRVKQSKIEAQNENDACRKGESYEMTEREKKNVEGRKKNV